MLMSAAMMLAATAALPDQGADARARRGGHRHENVPIANRADAGRRILSTAFVRVGPDNVLTIELRTGAVLALRNVTMRPRSFCGERVEAGGAPGRRTCGGYADVAAARPGPARAFAEPVDVVGDGPAPRMR